MAEKAMRAADLLSLSIVALTVACGGDNGGSHATPAAQPSTSRTSSAPATPAVTEPQEHGIRFPATAKLLNDIHFTDAQHGWAVGPGAIIDTTDRGKTWWNDASTAQDIKAIDLVDAQNGWALADGSLLAMSHGIGWPILSEPAGKRLIAIDFVSPTAGWGIITSQQTPPFISGNLVATSDGGRNWSDISTPAAVQSVCAAGNNVWTAGGRQVFRSTDGGATWSNSFTLPEAAGSSDWNTTIDCAGSAAWALFTDGGAAGHTPHIMYRTLDGSTWDVMMAEANTVANVIPASPSPGPYPGPFSVVDTNTAFVMGFCPACDNGTSTIRHTTDGGVSWSPDTLVGDGLEPKALDFIDSTHGWALLASATSAKILATTDGGATWVQQYP